MKNKNHKWNKSYHNFIAQNIRKLLGKKLAERLKEKNLKRREIETKIVEKISSPVGSYLLYL